MPSAFAPTLDAREFEFFRVNGYLAVDAITTQEEIRWLRDVYAELVANERALRLHYESAREGQPPAVIEQIFAPELLCPKLLETTYIANARRLASALLGVDVSTSVYGGLMLIFKPASAGRDTPWHQDEVYWEFPTQRCHSVSCWMPLDDVTVESGCMHFLPGSHALDVLRYRQPPGVEPLVLDEPVDLTAAVACPIPAGGATFHHCRTLHYTPPNTSTNPRRALTTITHGPRTERVPPLVRPWRGESPA